MNQDNKNEEKNSCQQEPETAEDAVKAPETENEEHMENHIPVRQQKGFQGCSDRRTAGSPETADG